MLNLGKSGLRHDDVDVNLVEGLDDALATTTADRFLANLNVGRDHLKSDYPQPLDPTDDAREPDKVGPFCP